MTPTHGPGERLRGELSTGPDDPLSGGCLCGGVRYEVARPVRDVFECHCRRCRTHTGNVMAATAAPADAITFMASSTLRWYAPEDDPDVQYGFCATCGSSLFWRAVGAADAAPGRTSDTSLDASPDTSHDASPDTSHDASPDAMVSICAGPLDGSTGLQTTEIWFADEARDHVTLTPGITRR